MNPVPIDALELALPRFLRRCDAESTREAYERELVRFLAWAKGRPSHELLFDYRDHLRERELGSTTVRWRTTVVRAFLLFARDRRHVDVDLVEDFKPPRGKSGFAPRVLSAGELTRLLHAPDRRTARGRRDAAVLVCLGVGGLRAGEVCRLNAEDLRIRGNCAVLHVHGKGRKNRLVPIAGRDAQILLSYSASRPETCKAGTPLLWCGHPGRESKRITVPAVDYLVRVLVAATGMTGVSAHALRHTAASLALEGGEPLHQLRDRLGHSSVLVTSRYLHWTAGVDA